MTASVQRIHTNWTPPPMRLERAALLEWYAVWDIGTRYVGRLGPFRFRWQAQSAGRRAFG